MLRPYQRSASRLIARYGRPRARGRALGGGNYIRTRAALGDIPVYGAQPPFNGYVEAWRALVEQLAGDLPVEFLLAWIDIESNGNPCSYTSLAEVGISQLEPPDNLVQGGTTAALQHPVPPCVPNAQSYATFDSLTADQAYEQVRAFVQYANYCRARAHAMLDDAGYSWDESSGDFWSVVKMVHVAPAVIPGMLAQGTAGNGGSPAPDWETMMRYVSGVPASWTNNAREVGLFGTGGGSLLTPTNIVMLGLLGLGLWYLHRATR